MGMDDIATRSRFSWWPTGLAGLGALLIFTVLITCSYDLGEMVYVLCVVPVGTLAVLGVAVFRKGSRRYSLLAAAAVFLAVSALLVTNAYSVRAKSRWIVGSKAYKMRVLSDSNDGTGSLKHIEWDGWGGFGSDTSVYLVFDPKNSLATAAWRRSAGKFDGIPCAVPTVYRLESKWYAVQFYTNQSWERCVE